MVLSTYVPDIIQANLSELLAPILTETYKKDDFAYWAVHPGGRAILDKVQQSLELDDSLLEPSRNTLRDFGNMSSATILFVLKNILQSEHIEEKPILSMAFGPGLTVETGIFNLIPAEASTKVQNEVHAAVS
jgi:predicted naringenin-chalcone synthase